MLLLRPQNLTISKASMTRTMKTTTTMKVQSEWKAMTAAAITLQARLLQGMRAAVRQVAKAAVLRAATLLAPAAKVFRVRLLALKAARAEKVARAKALKVAKVADIVADVAAVEIVVAVVASAKALKAKCRDKDRGNSSRAADVDLSKFKQVPERQSTARLILNIISLTTAMTARTAPKWMPVKAADMLRNVQSRVRLVKPAPALQAKVASQVLEPRACQWTPPERLVLNSARLAAAIAGSSRKKNHVQCVARSTFRTCCMKDRKFSFRSPKIRSLPKALV